MQTIQADPTNDPIFKASEETEKIINRLRQVAVDEVVTWLQVSECCGVYDKSRLYGLVETAKRHLLNENQYVFDAVRGVGLKRLNNVDVVAKEGTTTRKVRRAVKRSMRRLSTVNPQTLTKPDQDKYRVTSAALGAIALCSKPSSINKIKQLSYNGSDAIDPAQTLKLFV